MLELVDLFRSEFSNFFKDPFKKIKKAKAPFNKISQKTNIKKRLRLLLLLFIINCRKPSVSFKLRPCDSLFYCLWLT